MVSEHALREFNPPVPNFRILFLQGTLQTDAGLACCRTLPSLSLEDFHLTWLGLSPGTGDSDVAAAVSFRDGDSPVVTYLKTVSRSLCTSELPHAQFTLHHLISNLYSIIYTPSQHNAIACTLIVFTSLPLCLDNLYEFSFGLWFLALFVRKVVECKISLTQVHMCKYHLCGPQETVRIASSLKAISGHRSAFKFSAWKSTVQQAASLLDLRTALAAFEQAIPADHISPLFPRAPPLVPGAWVPLKQQDELRCGAVGMPRNLHGLPAISCHLC